jgi:NTE family protein
MFNALQCGRSQCSYRQFCLLRQYYASDLLGTCDRQRFPAARLPGYGDRGRVYWDGGLVSNTPLQWVLDSRPGKDTLAFQIDLWSARGEFPRNLLESETRQKEIRYSSRTRMATDQFKKKQILRRAAAKLLAKIPKELLQTAEAEMLALEADEKVYNLIQLIYRAKNYEGTSKDYEFSRRTMEEHWQSGYHDAVRTLRHPEVLQRPQEVDGVFTFDLARDGRE